MGSTGWGHLAQSGKLIDLSLCLPYPISSLFISRSPGREGLGYNLFFVSVSPVAGDIEVVSVE